MLTARWRHGASFLTAKNGRYLKNWHTHRSNNSSLVRKLYISAAQPFNKWHLSGSLLTSGSPMWPPGNCWGGSRGIIGGHKPPSPVADWSAGVSIWRFLSTVSSWLVRRKSRPRRRQSGQSPPPSRSWTSWTAMIGGAGSGRVRWLAGVRLMKRTAWMILF